MKKVCCRVADDLLIYFWPQPGPKKIMMGHRRVEQAALFYEFSLEKHVPPDHLLRSIDRFVELESEVRRELAGF